MTAVVVLIGLTLVTMRDTGSRGERGTEVLGEVRTQAGNGNTAPSETPTCQISPVRVRYASEYSASGGGYLVTHATVTGLDPSCDTAVVRVVLNPTSELDQSGIGAGEAPASDSGSVTVPIISASPALRDITAARVLIRGGIVPPPAECSGMTFDTNIFATPSDDTSYSGTSTADLVYLLGGEDVFDGASKDDCIVGGEGADTLSGSSANDRLLGEAGDDTLDGGSGNDRLYGGADNDTLFGGPGRDELYGGSGADIFDGGAGTKDVCHGRASEGDTFAGCETVVYP